MAAIPPLECNQGWTNLCGCPQAHNYCWPRPDTRCCDRLQYDDETPAEQVALIERMLRMSVEILHGLSGRQFGLCPRTVRPCKDDCAKMARPVWGWAANGGLLEPMLDGGKWYNATCGKCVTDCSCSSVCEVTLPGLVQSIVEVRLDGAVLDPETYRIDNHRKLVRVPPIVPEVTIERTYVRVTATPDGPLNVNDRVRMNPTPSAWTGAILYPGNYFGWDGIAPAGMSFDLQPGAFPQIEWILDPASDGFVFDVRDQGLNLFTWLTAPADVLAPGEDVSSAQTAGGTTAVIEGGTGLAAKLFSATSWETGPGNGGTGPGSVLLSLTRLVPDETGDCWPTCQNMSLPATEAGTFEVTYLRGKPVPEAGMWAAGLLACELIKACAPAAEGCECRLPSNVQSVVREGVSIDMEAFVLGGNGELGRTGIPEVDLWLSVVNPYKTVAPSRVYSVDRRRPRRTTWPCDD